MNYNIPIVTTKTKTQKKSLEQQIAHTDKEIDRLVYELYGLTEDEINVVEGGGQEKTL